MYIHGGARKNDAFSILSFMYIHGSRYCYFLTLNFLIPVFCSIDTHAPLQARADILYEQMVNLEVVIAELEG